MIVYRIVKSLSRANDFSGIGAFKTGGRWNSKGTYMLYASMNSSLAYLETLVHFNETDVPPNLYITAVEIKDSDTMIYQLPDSDYPTTWMEPDNLENKIISDQWIRENEFLAFKVRSAINPSEYNFLMNPLYPGFHDKIKVHSIELLDIDTRLIR